VLDNKLKLILDQLDLLHIMDYQTFLILLKVQIGKFMIKLFM